MNTGQVQAASASASTPRPVPPPNRAASYGGRYPADVVSQLLPGEEVRYFSYVAQKGGCMSSAPRDEHWVAMTNKRFMYKALVRLQDRKTTVEKDGVIPLAMVSVVQVTEVRQAGCSGTKSFQLMIGSSGNEIAIPILTREKGVEVRNAYSQIIHG